MSHDYADSQEKNKTQARRPDMNSAYEAFTIPQVRQKIMLRPLGAAERLLWMAGNHRTTQFAIALELSGGLDLQALQQAFDQVCTAALFRSKFSIDDAQMPWFVPSNGRGVVVALEEGDPAEWWKLFSQEVSTPLDDEVGLVRVSVLKAPGRASIVFCAHHALMDCLSAIEILVAVMRRLAGEAATVSVPGISVEEMVSQNYPRRDGMSPVPARPQCGDMIVRAAGERPAVATRVLGEAATSALRNKARVMGVSVYSAVCASLSAATLLIHQERRSSRFICPIDLRRGLFGGERHVGMYSTSILIDEDFAAPDIWRNALRFSQALEPCVVPGNLACGVRAHRELMAGVRTPRDATTLFSRCRADFLVSDLGHVDITGGAGPFRVEGVWGPSVNHGEESLQTIGLATHAGKLHFLHSSYRPAIGLLGAAVWVLENSL